MTKIVPLLCKCPKCSVQIKTLGFFSGNTFGAKKYSDTYLDAPMGVSPWSDYAGCSKCEAVFAINEAEKIEKNSEQTPKEWAEKLNLAAGPVPELETIKRMLLGPENIENLPSRRTLLLWYLWCFNHYSRNKFLLSNEKLSKNLNPGFLRGLKMIEKEKEKGDYGKYTEELIEILLKEKDNRESLLLAAEIMREKGDFERATEFLRNNFYLREDVDEKFRNMADQIKSAAIECRSDTFEIK